MNNENIIQTFTEMAPNYEEIVNSELTRFFSDPILVNEKNLSSNYCINFLKLVFLDSLQELK